MTPECSEHSGGAGVVGARFAVAGALCGLAGALVTGQVGAGTPGIGTPYLLDSIAAVVMGGTVP